MLRPTTGVYFLAQALLASTRSTCPRRRVGCVLTDSQGRVLSTGYNGVPKGDPHCIDTPCPGVRQLPGQGLHLCRAVHAEINAIIQCRNTDLINHAYVTASPCVFCVRGLMNTACEHISFLFEYPHLEARNEWVRTGQRTWRHCPEALEWIRQLFTENMPTV